MRAAIIARAGAFLLGCLTSLAQAEPRVEVQGLFAGRAALSVDGQLRLLKSGQSSPEGVTLVSATPAACVVEFAGQRQELSLSRRIASSFAVPDRREVSVARNERREYRTTATLDGQQLPVLVDTGATSVAMNADAARRIGVDYRLHGERTHVETASGVVNAYRVMLDEVSVGGVAVHQVEAVVMEGAFPSDILLGMSYLGRVEMQDQGGILFLRDKR